MPYIESLQCVSCSVYEKAPTICGILFLITLFIKPLHCSQVSVCTSDVSFFRLNFNAMLQIRPRSHNRILPFSVFRLKFCTHFVFFPFLLNVVVIPSTLVRQKAKIKTLLEYVSTLLLIHPSIETNNPAAPCFDTPSFCVYFGLVCFDTV